MTEMWGHYCRYIFLTFKKHKACIIIWKTSKRHNSENDLVNEQVRRLFSERWYLWCECLCDGWGDVKTECVRGISWYFHVCECLCEYGVRERSEMWKLMFLSLRDVTSLQRNKTSAVLVTGYAASTNWKLVPPYLEGKWVALYRFPIHTGSTR